MKNVRMHTSYFYTIFGMSVCSIKIGRDASADFIQFSSECFIIIEISRNILLWIFLCVFFLETFHLPNIYVVGIPNSTLSLNIRYVFFDLIWFVSKITVS